MLGPLEVLDDGGEPLPLGGPRPRALLALLLLNANEVVSVERLIDGVWDDDPPATAQSALQVHVHALRQAPRRRPDRDAARRATSLRVEDGELDADAFRAARRAGSARRCGGARSLARPRARRRRVRPFARADAARLEESRLAGLESRLAADLDGGRHAGLVAELEALVTEHPHRERLHAQHMLALYRSGRQADALAAYRRARAALDELGLEPSPDLRALERRILRQDPDLDLPTDAVPPTPPPADRLIGRDLERRRSRRSSRGARIRSSPSRERQEWASRVWAGSAGGVSTLVELPGIEDAALVPVELARALGCAEDPHPADRRGRRRGARDARRHRGARQLRARPRGARDPRVDRRAGAAGAPPGHEPRAAQDRGRARVPPGTAGAPAVGVDGARRRGWRSGGGALRRARSRRRARLRADRRQRRGDREDRATARRPATRHRAGCGSCARPRPGATASRLGDGIALLRRAAPDRPERQRSVSAAIDWSYRLLDPEQQRWFRALGVLAGGGSLELVEALRDGAVAADALDALVDASCTSIVPARGRHTAVLDAAAHPRARARVARRPRRGARGQGRASLASARRCGGR